MSNDNKEVSPSFETDVKIAEQHIADVVQLRENEQEELIDHEDYLLVEALSILKKRAKKYGQLFGSTKEAGLYFMLELAELEKEVFKVSFLNTRHQLIKTETVAIGTVDTATVSIREIAKLALQHNASAVILAHNHPSGITKPSESDKNFTVKVIRALNIFDLIVLDHFVVTGSEYHSMQEHQDITFNSIKIGYQKIL